jgi:hypothetical protein
MLRLPDYATIHANLVDNDVTTVIALFGQVPQGGRETDTYTPLVRGPIVIRCHLLTVLCTRPPQSRRAFDAMHTLLGIAHPTKCLL